VNVIELVLHPDPTWLLFAIVALLVLVAVYAVFQRIEHP
jgi:hypothetical protein